MRSVAHPVQYHGFLGLARLVTAALQLAHRLVRSAYGMPLSYDEGGRARPAVNRGDGRQGRASAAGAGHA